MGNEIASKSVRGYDVVVVEYLAFGPNPVYSVLVNNGVGFLGESASRDFTSRDDAMAYFETFRERKLKVLKGGLVA